jgi:hypothetical protein
MRLTKPTETDDLGQAADPGAAGTSPGFPSFRISRTPHWARLHPAKSSRPLGSIGLIRSMNDRATHAYTLLMREAAPNAPANQVGMQLESPLAVAILAW